VVTSASHLRSDALPILAWAARLSGETRAGYAKNHSLAVLTRIAKALGVALTDLLA